MPLPGIHLIALENARDKLLQETDPRFSGAGQIINDNLNFARVGAIAQDLLYVAPDIFRGAPVLPPPFGAYLQNIQDLLVDFLEFFEPLFVIKAEAELLNARVENGIDLISGGLLNEFKETVELAKETIMNLTVALVSANIDVWDLISPAPPISDGHREVAGSNSWSFGDHAHFRCTGKFAQVLYNKAKTRGDERFQAFAFGAASHIATDTVVHPFVNGIVGGPFRNHSHRHHFVENFLDVLAWYKMVNGRDGKPQNILDSDFVERFNISAVSRIPIKAEDIILAVNMPEELTELMAETVAEVYEARSALGPLSAEQIQLSYKIFILATKLSVDRIEPPKPPPFIVLDDIVKLLDDLKNLFGLTPPPGFSPGSTPGLCLSFDCLETFFDNIVEFGQWAVEQLEKLLSASAAFLNFVANLAKQAALYLLYLIQVVLYQLYRACRKMMLWSGLCLPYDLDELKEVDRQYSKFNPKFGNSLVTTPFTDPLYPRKKGGAGIFNPRHHVPYPNTTMESPGVLFSRIPGYFQIEFYIKDAPFDPAAVEKFLNASSPEQTAALIFPPPGPGSKLISLGNAIDFTAFLIKEAVQNQLSRHDWNLDGDRGQTWKNWSWLDPFKPGTDNVKALYSGCNQFF